MRRMSFFVLFVSCLGLSLPSRADEKVSPQASSPSQLNLKPKGSYTLKDLQDLVKAQTVTVTEPHEHIPIQFEAIPLKDLLDKVYGPTWRQKDEILFTCSDGYQPSLPVQKILQHDPSIAFSAVGRPFSIVNKLQNDEKVELGPFYLIWENQKDKSVIADGASIWPYQLVGLEFVRFEDRFAAMAPPSGSKDQVKRGFLAFRQYCQSCHRINGQGGEKSLELNYPVNVTEYWNGKYLERWIVDPQSIRWGTTMPPLNPELKNRNEVVREIVAYLRAMKQKKIQPK